MDNTHILIAEDDPNSAMILSRILMRAGFPEPTMVTSGQDALEATQKKMPDILISDIGMPGELDGIQVAEQVKAHHALPIIFITGFSDKSTIERAKQTEPAAYILKPFKKEDVLIAIEMALHKARMTKELKASERTIRMMAGALQSISDGVFVTDVNFTDTGPLVIYANQGAETVTGYPQEEIVNQTLHMFEGPRSEKHYLAKLKSQVMQGQSYSWENINYRKTQEKFTAQWTVSPVKEENGSIEHLVFVVRDVTQLRQLEENQRQSQKIEAMGRFTGGIAHDFNNLLAVINSYSDLLKLKLDTDSPFIKYIDNIRSAGQRGTDLVAQLMTFSRRKPSTPVVMNLADVTRETEKMLRRLIRENIQVETHYEPDTQPIKANPSQIEQILVNLCVNARDAIAETGKISIRIENHTATKEQSTATGEVMPTGNYVSLGVTDTGSGMSEEIRKNIFDPFFTTKDVGKGTGLGLSTVYGIIRQAGAYVTVASKLGKGSTFTIYFPSTKQDISEKSIDEREIDLEDLKGCETILIVEDDTNFADSIAGALHLHGYKALKAHSGTEALKQYGPKADDIHLIIADIVLPNISGRELASRFLDLNPELCVIFMTGYDSELDTHYSFPADSMTFQKPFPIKTMLAKVRQMLDDSQKR